MHSVLSANVVFQISIRFLCKFTEPSENDTCFFIFFFINFFSYFLVSGRDLACQQEVSLALTKTPPIHYYNVVDSAFSNYAG